MCIFTLQPPGQNTAVVILLADTAIHSRLSARKNARVMKMISRD